MLDTWSRTSIRVCVGLVAAAVTGSVGTAEELTLEAIFGTADYHRSVPTDIVWLPDGGGFLFRDSIDDIDGLYRHDVATGETELVVDWREHTDRLAVLRPEYLPPALGNVNTHPSAGRSPIVSPDGRYYLAEANGDLYLLDLGDGAVRYLTGGPGQERFAAFSPEGSRVAFARDGDLFWVDLPSGDEHRITDRGGHPDLVNGVADWVYEEELDVKRSFWWSPGGDRIAFVQYDTSAVSTFPITDQLELIAGVEWQKYPKAGGANAAVRLGVVRIPTGETAWVTTGVGDGYIARAGWVPAGGELWFQVLNRAQDRLELRFARAGEGSSRLVVVEHDEAWVNVSDDLSFVDDERFVWSSERDGHRHLYLYDFDGHVIRRLTRGEWEVVEVSGIDAARDRVVFVANAENLRERHVYSVSLDGGTPSLLTTAPGTHRAKLAPDGRHFLDTFSDLTTPDRLDLYDVVGSRVRTVDDGAIAALDGHVFNRPEFGTIEADDGETLHTWMIRPPDFDPATRYPVLVYVYGGPHAQLVVNRWGGTRYLFYEYLARKGLIIFCVDNRGTWGRGRAFEAMIHRRLGELELADQLAGVRYLKSLPFVDDSRIGVYGGSYGGYMTLLAMNKAPEHFKVGVAYAPVTHWKLYDSIYTERYMGTPEKNPEGYRDSAPVNFADGLQGKLLICHGTMDNNVHLQHTIQMARAYIEAGKLFDLMLYPRVRHPIRVSNQRLHFHRLKSAFLEEHLIGGGS